jgi:hypothetical protein
MSTLGVTETISVELVRSAVSWLRIAAVDQLSMAT